MRKRNEKLIPLIAVVWYFRVIRNHRTKFDMLVDSRLVSLKSLKCVSTVFVRIKTKWQIAHDESIYVYINSNHINIKCVYTKNELINANPIDRCDIWIMQLVSISRAWFKVWVIWRGKKIVKSKKCAFLILYTELLC